ncbi:cytochrome b/b6 domain-containing protein [Rhodobacteraceae bacterium KMM 6894]|nr:cytochrome b/b6 domain-containing protein [Rhodobacteraceae bacterium KMM 6894]
MPRQNTPSTYGSITRLFHWLTALMIAALFALGIIASEISERITAADGASSDALIGWAKLLFSTHKTLGIALFAVAVLRILWALSQPRPRLLNGDNWLESRLAETVHWLLYGSLIAVPLSGWVHHAASAGFAPIWWPLGQGLPFVPIDPYLSKLAGTLHYLLQWVLAGAIVLHVIGALKHHVIDRDATLRRMWSGIAAEPTEHQPGHVLPLIAALAIWGAVIGGAAGFGWFAPQTGGAPTLETVDSDWQVQDGTLQITISQMGADVTGRFADWTAGITYGETADATGKHGAVAVTINIGSLTLGSVTDQAMGPDYFDASTWPTAEFDADLINAEQGLIADGTLRIRDQSVPVQMPVTLQIEGDTATASGRLTVDRRDFQIGQGTTDPDSLGFAVLIDWQLTATRGQ